MPHLGRPKVLRRTTRGPKKEKKDCTLEKVLGFTITSNASVSLDPTSGAVAYPAGSVVVGYLPKKNKQFFLKSASKCPITTIAFSKDGKLLATGESGKYPKVRVWNVEQRCQVNELAGHNFRVNVLAFSPNSRYLVSIGSQEDSQINVWEMWNNCSRIASSKITCKINAMAFCESGSGSSDWFVTVGTRHVRYWYLDGSSFNAGPNSALSGPSLAASNSTLSMGSSNLGGMALGDTGIPSTSNYTKPLNGRNAVLQSFMNNTFNDVACCYVSGDKSNMAATKMSTDNILECAAAANSNMTGYQTGSQGVTNQTSGTCGQAGSNFISASGGSINNSCSGGNYIFVVTQAGQLLQFTEQRYLNRWVELRNTNGTGYQFTPKASSLSVNDQYVVVGCSRGIVFVFCTGNLSHVCNLPMPHTLGLDLHVSSKNLCQDPSLMSPPLSRRYADVIAHKYDYIHSRVTCFYSDHSIIAWDIRDIKNPVKISSNLFHSGGVWSVESVPLNSRSPWVQNQQNPHYGNILDTTSFITCSDDETIRFWYLPPPITTNTSNANNNNNSSANLINTSASDNNSISRPSVVMDTKEPPAPWKNCYSKDLIKILYTDPKLRHLLEIDRYLTTKRQNTTECLVPNKIGIRSIKVSPNGEHLAVGDRDGCIKFYSLSSFELLYNIEGHSSEILSIDYLQSPSTPELILFCSASRDRQLHVMDPNLEYKCIQTLEDHSGAICAARLVETPDDQEIRLVSCGMDKSLLLRILQPEDTCRTAQFFLNQHLVSRQSHYDLCVLPDSRSAAVVSQDRKVRLYNLVTGKQKKSYRGSLTDDGNLVSCSVDPTGTFIATAGSDKTITLLYLATGEIVCSMFGHGEPGLSVCFLDDLRHIVTVSQDSCIFVWRLPSDVVLTMQRNMKQKQRLSSATVTNSDINVPATQEIEDLMSKIDRKSSVSKNEILLDANNSEKARPSIDHSTPATQKTASLIQTDPSIAATPGPPQTVPYDPATNEPFRFSVSALPGWAQKKVNMGHDYITGSSRNSTTSRQSALATDHISMHQMHSSIGSIVRDSMKSPAGRRLSFIATEKKIVEDDSDNNMEDEDPGVKVELPVEEESEDFTEEDEDEDDDINDDDEDDRSPTDATGEVPAGDESSQFTFRASQEPSQLQVDLMSTSAPSALSNWLIDQELQTSPSRLTSNRLSYDGEMMIHNDEEYEDNEALETTLKRNGNYDNKPIQVNKSAPVKSSNNTTISNTTSSSNPPANSKNSVNFIEPEKKDDYPGDVIIPGPPNIVKQESKTSFSRQKKLTKKAVSELNVSSISSRSNSQTVRSASYKSKLQPSQTNSGSTVQLSSKPNQHSNRAPSAHPNINCVPQNASSRPTQRKSATSAASNLHKNSVISISSVSIASGYSEHSARGRAHTSPGGTQLTSAADSTHRARPASSSSNASHVNPGSRLSYTHTQASTNRAKWADLQHKTGAPKKPLSRSQRRTCPINFQPPLKVETDPPHLDSPVSQDSSSTTSAVRPTAIPNSEVGIIKQPPIKPQKEHDIDDLNESNATSNGRNGASSSVASYDVDNMFSRILPNNNMSDLSRVISSSDTPLSDDWLMNLCADRSRDELVELCVRILKHSLNRGDWTNAENNEDLDESEAHDEQSPTSTNQNKEITLKSYGLLRDVEKVTGDLKNKLINTESVYQLEEIIARDIGEKILDEVKKKLSEAAL